MAENRKFLSRCLKSAGSCNRRPLSSHCGCGCSRLLPLGLALEALIVLLCLIPGEGRIQAARHAALLVFCATTYALAPVAGFGWLIATMGLAQGRPDQPRLRGAYVAAFILILLYSEIPWTGVLAAWIGR
jgi:hypothetical protein